MRILHIAIASVFSVAAVTSAQISAPATSPATAPATNPTTNPASRPVVKIDTDARPILEHVRRAYSVEQTIQFHVQITGEFDIAGRAKKYDLQIDSETDGQGRFIHRVKDVGTVAQNADKLTVYDQRRNSYGILKTPGRRKSSADLPNAAVEILLDENPSLLLTLSGEPDQALLLGAQHAGVRDGRLVITSESEIRTVELDDDGFIRRMEIDYRPLFTARSTNNVQRANVEVVYTETRRGAAAADNAFDFVPPETASEFLLKPDPPATQPDRPRRNRMPGAPATGPATMPAASD